jgi:WD40 repeat protein
MHFPEETFKAIPKMSKEEAGSILDNWLRDAKRSLTSQQRQNVLNAFNKCPLPLFLKLAFDEACRWKSYTPENETNVPSTIREIIHSLFDRLERIHGKMLVSHALAYISGSKNGLTESELEDLLSLDDDVLNDVYQYWTPPVRRLPPLIWLRVRSDLGDYLVERGSDGARVSFWYHRQFIEVSRERYLLEQESVKVHSNMAEYFQGTWSGGKKKPFVNKQGEHLEMDRLVAQQPLMYDANEESVVFNKRKLAELPYHLVKSKQLNELKETVLCNYNFLFAKLRGMPCSLVMDDFRMAVNVFPEDEELQLLYDTIGLSVNALKLEPRQLPSQLIGRLFNMQEDASSSNTHPSITKLLQQLRSSPVPYFVPHAKCLTSSGGPLLHAIAEHDESMIDSICLSHDNSTVVTTVRGNEGLEIRIFNVRAGLLERKLTLTEPIPDVFFVWHIIMSRRDKQKLVMIGGRNILVFDLKSGEMVHQIEALGEDLAFNQTGSDIPPVALGNGDQSVAALTDKGIKIWNIETGSLEHEVPVKGVDTSGSMGALDASNEYVAYCKKDSTDVTIIRINSGEIVQTIKSSVQKSSGSYVKFIKLTDEGKLVVMSSNSTELKVFDAASGKLLKNVVGFSANTTIKELLITSDGKKLICQDKYDLAIWDMESWKCRNVLNDMANIHSPNVKTNDGKIVVHANITDHIVRIYDASKDEGKEATADAASANQWVVNQINSLYPSCDNRHFITTGTANMASEISIWDVNQGKQVRVFKSLNFYPNVLRMVSPTLGVGYIYNEKMNHYALLDFAEGKMVRQLEGKACKRMYMMEFLDKDRMVSFTRGRRHLKVWNIQSGKVIQQIKLGQKHRLEAFLLSGNKKVMVIAQFGAYSGEMKDKTIPLIVYDFASGKQHEIRENEQQLKFEVAGWSINGSISHTGRYIINVNDYTSAILWDVTAGRKLHSLSSEQQPGAIYSSAIIEDKNIALTSFAGAKNGVFMWDMKSGECVKEIITVAQVNEIKPSVDQRLVFWKDMQGPNFFVHELESGRNLASFTSDQPIAPQVFSVINNHVVIGATGSIDPVIFCLRQGNEFGTTPVGSSVFEDGSDVTKTFVYDVNTLPPDPHDVDNDKDDDKGQAC